MSYAEIYPKKLSFKELINQYVDHIRLSNEKSGSTGDSSLMGKWDIARFTDYMIDNGFESYHSNNMRKLYNCYVSALHVSLFGIPPIVERYVDKSIENAEYATLLWKMYPYAKFIHIIRNPYATLVSLRKHVTRDHYPFLGTLISSLNNSYYYLYKNPLVIDEYQVIRYEDLISNPRKLMTTLSTFIDIEFTESKLKPTTMGAPWIGNSTSGMRFNGISDRPLKTWQKDIHPLEIRFVNHFFPQIFQDYKYKVINNDKSYYFPLPGENLKTYLANRFVWLIGNATPSKPIIP